VDADLHDGLDLPDAEFDYDEYVEREFGGRIKPAGIKTIWWITAMVLLAVALALFLFKG
jgi:hypothetical protein